MSIRPSNAALARLADRAAVPRYDRGRLRAGLLHIGVGNFHRAHQAVYLDDLFNRGRDHDWAIVGAGVQREADMRMRAALEPQDWLTTVVAREAERTEVRVTGAMIDYLAPGDAAALVACLADPAIRIVSLTITEGGYYIDPATQLFDADHPDIVADARNPASPRTVFGLILAGLRRRRLLGVAPFTVMSCDNIPGNGHVTGNAVAGLADLMDAGLAAFVRGEVAFPDSMVDRITPATTDRERAILAERGIDDAWPVFCEEFRQWVVEDRFPAGRPALEEVGVQFVADVAPFELMKIRVLNGGHAALAYPAALLDIHFVHDAMADGQVRGFLDRLEREEIVPAVPPVPGTSLAAYQALVMRRFANPQVGDTIPRLCADGSNRQPKFILPTVADRLRQGAPVDGLALVGALWCRYCAGTTDSGAPVPGDDPNWARLQAHARHAKGDPRAFLALADIFGDIGTNETYASAFAAALDSLWRTGTRPTLARYLDRPA